MLLSEMLRYGPKTLPLLDNKICGITCIPCRRYTNQNPNTDTCEEVNNNNLFERKHT